VQVERKKQKRRKRYEKERERGYKKKYIFFFATQKTNLGTLTRHLELHINGVVRVVEQRDDASGHRVSGAVLKLGHHTQCALVEREMRQLSFTRFAQPQLRACLHAVAVLRHSQEVALHLRHGRV
jgi:hypothetical protein